MEETLKQKMSLGASPRIFQFAEDNRKKETPAEALLYGNDYETNNSMASNSDDNTR